MYLNVRTKYMDEFWPLLKECIILKWPQVASSVGTPRIGFLQIPYMLYSVLPNSAPHSIPQYP